MFETLFVSKQRVSPFYRDSQLLHERNVFRFPENGALFLSKQRVSPFYRVLDLGLGWLGTFRMLNNFSFWLSSNFGTQVLHPIMFQGNLWRRPRCCIYFLVYDLSSFHPDNFRDTINWECFVKNDGVRSCLIELQSFFQSKIDVDPIFRVLMFLPCFIHFSARRGALKSIVSEYLCSLSFGSTGRKNTVCLSLKFCPPGINPGLMMECNLIAHPT